MYDARSPRRLSAPGAFHALQHRATPNLSFFLGDIRPRSRQLAPPGKLRCVLTPSASLRARVPQFFGAVKGAPERHVRVAKPYDSTSALRHEANTRPKGALRPPRPARRIVQRGRGGAAGSGPRGIGPDSMNLRRSLSVDHIDIFQFVEVLGIYVGNWFETCIVWACYDRKPNFFAKMTNILDKMTR